MQIFSIYGDDITPEILVYLNAMHAQDTFSISVDDYAIFFGVETKANERYIFVAGIDIYYNKKVGFFQKVDEWPYFTTEKTPIEEVFKHRDRNAWPK